LLILIAIGGIDKTFIGIGRITSQTYPNNKSISGSIGYYIDAGASLGGKGMGLMNQDKGKGS